MPSPVSAAVGYGRAVVRSVSDGWNAFWYTPADPTLLGAIRILTGLMLVYTHAVWGLGLNDFFGPDSWISPRLTRLLQFDQYTFSFWWWVPYRAMWPAYAMSMLILVLFTVGFWTRLTSLLALGVAISFANRVPLALFGLDQINVMLTLYLTIGPSGAALSIDQWRRRQNPGQAPLPPMPRVTANLALRLIQVHMCVIYFFAGISKLQGPSWWSGEAMWRIANLEYQSADMTWLAWHPWLINFMTHVSVLWELSFCVLIWKPLWRPVILATAVILHVGIGACLGMWTFGLIMLVGCSSFLPAAEVGQIAAAWLTRSSAKRERAAQSPAPREPVSRRSGSRQSGLASYAGAPETSRDPRV